MKAVCKHKNGYKLGGLLHTSNTTVHQTIICSICNIQVSGADIDSEDESINSAIEALKQTKPTILNLYGYEIIK